MLKPGLNESYDVIVIGSGVGGLTAAALLTKAGYRVCVLEKEPHAGGYLAGFRRKNFLFDTAIHWLNQYGPGGLICRIFDLVGKDYPTAVPQQRIRRYMGNNFNYLLTNNPDEWRDQLIKEYPHEEKGIRKFFASAKKIGRSFKEFNTVFRSKENMTTWEKITSGYKTFRFVIPFIPYVMYSGEKGLKKGLNKFFKDPNLHRIFASEHELIGCFVPIGWAYYGDFQSPPKGGSQMIPKWLQHNIESRGGQVLFQSKVTEIIVEENQAKGVHFLHRNKAYTFKSRYVIAANDIETIYEKMLPASAIPAKLKEKLRQAELYTSSVTLSIALDCPAEELGFNEEMIHLVDENLPFDAYSNGNPDTVEVSVLAATVRDKTLCPEHQGTLTIYMPAEMKYMDEWKTTRDAEGNYVRGEAYKELKQEIAEKLIARVEDKIAPGLKSHILFYEVATPVTHYRYTGNKNGTMMGARPGRANMQAKIAHYQTPVRNLILGGHWAELGGGVPIAVKAGANAAFLIFKNERPSLFKSMARYMDGKVSLEESLLHPEFSNDQYPFSAAPTPSERAKLREANVREVSDRC
jgi:prolycopene isomerase